MLSVDWLICKVLNADWQLYFGVYFDFGKEFFLAVFFFALINCKARLEVINNYN